MLAISVIGSKWKIVKFVDPIPLRIRIYYSLVKEEIWFIWLKLESYK